MRINGNATIGSVTAGSLVVNGGNSGGAPIGQGILSLVDGTVNTLTLANYSAATTFTIGSNTAGNTSILNMEVGSIADQIVLPANAQISAGSGGIIVNITGLGGLSGQKQTLINAPGGFSNGSFANFTLGTLSGNFNGYTVALSSDATHLYLTETGGAPPATAYWNGTTDANWPTYNSGITNWVNGPQGIDLGRDARSNYQCVPHG